MSDTDVRTTFAQILADVVEVPAESITDDQLLIDDLDVDSLSLVEIMMLVEEQLGVKLDDESVAELRTVGDVVARVESSLVRA
ncbi:acyl carrier protein [Krasilnikovia sp. M28-CT-15]|uniref:acyl carrier protein n=1 Tax=Krasilnikovia sp. M28-CT-15 TaxID=3373540 RepID=UPI003876A4F2